MRTISDPQQMRQWSIKARSHGKTVGFVPTMGYLHQGHQALIEAARRSSDLVVVSIFVNPLQFGPSEDYHHYPRDVRRDKKLLESLNIDILFVPEPAKMFPHGFKTYVEVEELSKRLCGKTRPGHFRGVATVVAKLLNLVQPDRIYFGEKDYQQLLVIKRMVEDLNFPVQIVGLSTVREYDGLAMSSRNSYLSPSERKAANILHKALALAKDEAKRGEHDAQKLGLRLRSLIGSEPSVRLDYLVFANPTTLEEVRQLRGKTLVALAAHVGKARLIDNVII
jgi:pantoate--beta-alanine ligase